LNTTCLTLTPYTPTDEERFVSLFGNEDVARWMGVVRSPMTSIRPYSPACLRHPPATTVPGHEIVYALKRTAWGQGLGRELVGALVAYGFNTLRLTQIYATVAMQNTASLAVLARLGFRHLRDINEEGGTVTRVLVLENESVGNQRIDVR
jgi:Acetyltransferase (GNAT) domain